MGLLGDIAADWCWKLEPVSKNPENRKILNHGITRNYTDEDLNLEVGCNGTTISVCFRVVPWLCCF
jgi:hypothetical protein